MNLTDVLPCTAEELFKLQHEHSVEVERDTIKLRKARLKPFSDAYKLCLESCGSLTSTSREEYAIHMAAIALIDILIEEYSKKNAL